MSTMTLEQVRDALRVYNIDADEYRGEYFAKSMADAIDALLRERESAKAAVTDEMVCRADVAQREFFESTPFTGDSDRLTHESVRAALEAVAPMLPSARVPDNLLAAIHKVVKGYPSRRQQGYFMGEIREMLTAAPKPEKE